MTQRCYILYIWVLLIATQMVQLVSHWKALEMLFLVYFFPPYLDK